jgi:hypothetical protein
MPSRAFGNCKRGLNREVLGTMATTHFPSMPPPSGWCDDTLTAFIEHANRHRWATFDNKREQYQHLAEIDRCFWAVTEGWEDPPNRVTPMLYYRTLGAYRGACEHAMAGQVAEAFPLLRACLEYSGYALHIQKDPALQEVWLRRHDDHATFGRALSEFKTSRIKATVAENTDAEISRQFEELYQRAIDFGGHPNERAVTGNMDITRLGPGRLLMQQILLHDDGPMLDYGLKATAETGLCALQVLRAAFEEKFKATGQDQVLAELLKRL